MRIKKYKNVRQSFFRNFISSKKAVEMTTILQFILWIVTFLLFSYIIYKGIIEGFGM